MSMKMLSSRVACLAIAALALISAPSSSRGDLIIDVNWNTQPLVDNLGAYGPFYLNFNLSGGSTPNTSQIEISNIVGATSVGSSNLFGGAVGDIDSGFTLMDSGFFNDAYQEFTPSSMLSFRITVKTPIVEDVFADRFIFAILYEDANSNLVGLRTLDDSDSALLAFDLTTNLNAGLIETYGSNQNSTNPPVSPFEFEAPTFQIQPNVIPEPTSVALLGAGLAGLGLWTVRRRRAA